MPLSLFLCPFHTPSGPRGSRFPTTNEPTNAILGKKKKSSASLKGWVCADQGMGPSKRGGGEGEDGKRARAEAGGQAQDGVPDTAGELSAKAPAGGEVGQRAAVVQDPAAQDPAPARSRGSDDLTDPDEHGLHGIDRAHELLLALQNRTGNGPDKDDPERSQGCLGLRRGEDRPHAVGRGVTDASKKAVRMRLGCA